MDYTKLKNDITKYADTVSGYSDLNCPDFDTLLIIYNYGCKLLEQLLGLREQGNWEAADLEEWEYWYSRLYAAITTVSDLFMIYS